MYILVNLVDDIFNGFMYIYSLIFVQQFTDKQFIFIRWKLIFTNLFSVLIKKKLIHLILNKYYKV